MNAKRNVSVLSVLAPLALVAVLAPSLAGCLVVGDGPDDSDITISDDPCYDRCETRNDTCGTGVEINCENVCDLYDEMDCTAEVNAYDDCRDEEQDICGAPPACEGKFEAATSCFQAYCDAHPNEEGNIFCY